MNEKKRVMMTFQAFDKKSNMVSLTPQRADVMCDNERIVVTLKTIPRMTVVYFRKLLRLVEKDVWFFFRGDDPFICTARVESVRMTPTGIVLSLRQRETIGACRGGLQVDSQGV